MAVLAGVTLLATCLGARAPVAGGAPQTVAGAVRVDQVGYATHEPKRAFLLAEAPAGGAPFAVADAGGVTVLSGRVGRRSGGWNARFPAVHPIDFGALRRPGRYRIVVGGTVDAASPPFRVASRDALFGKLVDDTVRFFQAQRDGAHVPALLDRKPSHLADRRATVYDTPVFTGDGGDVPAAPLQAEVVPPVVRVGSRTPGDSYQVQAAQEYARSS
jgi:hypothetical protein